MTWHDMTCIIYITYITYSTPFTSSTSFTYFLHPVHNITSHNKTKRFHTTPHHTNLPTCLPTYLPTSMPCRAVPCCAMPCHAMPCIPYIHTYRQTDRQTYRHIHTDTYIQTHTYRHIHTDTYIQTHTYIYIHTHTYIHIHTYIQTDRQTDRHTYMHWYIAWYSEWEYQNSCGIMWAGEVQACYFAAGGCMLILKQLRSSKASPIPVSLFARWKTGRQRKRGGWSTRHLGCLGCLWPLRNPRIIA